MGKTIDMVDCILIVGIGVFMSFITAITHSVKIYAEDIVCLQTTWSNGDIVYVVMAKVNGKWEIVERSYG